MVDNSLSKGICSRIFCNKMPVPGGESKKFSRKKTGKLVVSFWGNYSKSFFFLQILFYFCIFVKSLCLMFVDGCTSGVFSPLLWITLMEGIFRATEQPYFTFLRTWFLFWAPFAFFFVFSTFVFCSKKLFHLGRSRVVVGTCSNGIPPLVADVEPLFLCSTVWSAKNVVDLQRGLANYVTFVCTNP